MLWNLVLLCLLSCCGIMVVAWFWANSIKNAGVVDIFWSYNFPIIAVILWVLAPGYEVRKLIICAMVIVAGLRLGTHLAIRIVSHIREEEGRYKQLRKEWAPHAERKFFFFYQFQAISNVLLAVPFFIICMNLNTKISPFEYAGVTLWLVSVCGETLSDFQLAEFKKNTSNKGKVCDKGLWYYSRHPNYFFEWLIWVSYFIFALGSPLGYLAFISPAIILYLLLKVTGIPATEEQSLRSKGDEFKKYQKSTSVFIPWFKKN